MTLDSYSSRWIVHLECPFGTGPQASSISQDSVRPSTLRLALSELHVSTLTGTLSALLQNGITRNTKGVTICQRWDLLEIASMEKD